MALLGAMAIMVVPGAQLARADTVENRHLSGIVLLPPLDIAEIVRQGPIYEPLGKAWSDALELAGQSPDVFGYPWADRAKGELVIAIVNAQGEAIARSWMKSAASQALGGKRAPNLLPPQVPVRFRTVDRSFRQLETIKNEAIGRGAAGFAGENRIWESGVDGEHERVVLTTDRVVDAFLFALAKKYGTEIVAVRVDPHAGSSTTLPAASEPSATGRQLAVVGGIGVIAALSGGLWLLVKARRSAA